MIVSFSSIMFALTIVYKGNDWKVLRLTNNIDKPLAVAVVKCRPFGKRLIVCSKNQSCICIWLRSHVVVPSFFLRVVSGHRNFLFGHDLATSVLEHDGLQGSHWSQFQHSFTYLFSVDEAEHVLEGFGPFTPLVEV